MSPPLAKHPLRLVRPATIEFRYSNAKKYYRQIKLFRRALKPKSGTVDSTATSYTFPVGLIPKGKNVEDMAFRFLLLKRGQIGSNRTIVYWEVRGGQIQNAADSLNVAVDSLKRAGFAVVEPPVKSGTAIQAILEDTSDSDSTVAITPGTSTGRMVGLVVNPPYPTLIDTAQGIAVDTTGRRMNNSTPKDAANFPGYWLWLGCLLCLALGFLVGRAWKK